MNLLNTLTTGADEEQLRLHPLPEHAIASQNEHLRSHYALLLAAVLTAQQVVSEPQTRLLRLLLDSLKLGDIRGQLFDQARELEPEALLEAVRLIREAGFAHHLVVDALVLLRLDAPLNDEAARLAGELANFLGLDESALVMRAMDASDILGLGTAEAAHSQLEAENTDDDAGEDVEQRPAVRPVQLSELWPAQLRQPLTEQALRAGLQGGLWVLNANLDVDFAWQATDAILFFRNGAILNTFAKEGAIKLTSCRLVDAVLDFQGACTITLERCDWQGNYDPAANRTALTSNGQVLTVTDCQFSTRNARAILVANNALVLTGSCFTRCGHGEINGGSVCHTDHKRNIENCRFDRCLATYGGAIFVNYLYGIKKCEFIFCKSLSLCEKNAGDIAVYGTARNTNDILNCVFRKTSLRIGEARSGGKTFVRLTQFNQSNVYYQNKFSNDYITGDCTFVNGREIEMYI